MDEMRTYLFRLCLIFIFMSGLFVGCNRRPAPHKSTPRVKTSKIEKQDVPIYIDAIGQSIPTVTVNIRPQVAGKLIKTYLQQGDIVEEGELIYEIDPRPYQAILDETTAQLAHDEALLTFASQQVLRNKKVVEQEFLSLLNFEQFQSNEAAAKAQVELDKAAITAARINVEFCSIVAPVSGKISFFNVDVGNILTIDDPNQITVIRPFSPIDVLFSLPQQQLELIRSVQGNEGHWPFIATLPEKPNESFHGTTFFIDNQVNQNTGTILLKGRLPNENRELWPGEFMRIKVLYRIAPDALTVPPSAVIMGRDGPFVYTIDKDEKAALVNVTVLTRTPEYIAIQSDKLQEGEVVITDGQINIAPGVKVKVTAPQALPPSKGVESQVIPEIKVQETTGSVSDKTL